MDDLETRFLQAVAASRQGTERPDNLTLLKMYGLYKQATLGDAQGPRPGFSDLVGRAKFDAWSAVMGKSRESAMQDYVALIESLK